MITFKISEVASIDINAINDVEAFVIGFKDKQVATHVYNQVAKAVAQYNEDENLRKKEAELARTYYISFYADVEKIRNEITISSLIGKLYFEGDMIVIK